MPEPAHNLGKLQSIHGVSPAFLQRAVIVAVLSFIFFLLMLGGFYVRQNIGYFIISMAFLMIYILTMLSWLRQRRNAFMLYQNGFTFNRQTFLWSEIETFEGRAESRPTGVDKMNYEIGKSSGEKIVLTEAIADVEKIIELISEKIDEGAVADEPVEK